MKRLVSLVALLAALSVVGWGYTIDLLNPSNRLLWNTGFTSAGNYGMNDQQDGHYTWVRWSDATRTSLYTPVPNSGQAYIINDAPAFPLNVWRPNIANTAAWVSYDAGPPELNKEAWYTYYTSFTLPTTFTAWNVNLILDVWADNQPQFVGLYSGNTLLDAYNPPPAGSGIPTAHLGGYDSSPDSKGFALSAILVPPGTYTIRFDVFNAAGSSQNPTGLFVLFNTATAEGVPEPGTYALMGTVGLALYLLRRRKTAVKS